MTEPSSLHLTRVWQLGKLWHAEGHDTEPGLQATPDDGGLQTPAPFESYPHCPKLAQLIGQGFWQVNVPAVQLVPAGAVHVPLEHTPKFAQLVVVGATWHPPGHVGAPPLHPFPPGGSVQTPFWQTPYPEQLT